MIEIGNNLAQIIEGAMVLLFFGFIIYLFTK